MLKAIGTLAAGLAIAAAALGAGVAGAQSPPNPPARFAGTVTVNGQPAPAGATVEARVGSVSCGTTTVFMEGGNANYVVDVPAATTGQNCGTEGSTVTLFVNGQQAGSGPWRNFELNVVNLAAQTATPTPTSTATATGTATATRTATPRPPVVGTGVASDGGSNLPIIAAGAGIVLAAAAAGFATARKGRATRNG